MSFAITLPMLGLSLGKWWPWRSKRLNKESKIYEPMCEYGDKVYEGKEFALKKLIDLQGQLIKHFLGEIELNDTDRVRYLAMIEVLKQVVEK